MKTDPAPTSVFCSFEIAKLIERCSNGVEDQGAEEALRGQEKVFRPKPCEGLSFSADLERSCRGDHVY
jgi:hypothetical protein